METYKYIDLENGDILLEKNIIELEKYNMTYQENGDLILKLIKEIKIKDKEEIKRYDFKKSIIQKCIINNKKINKLKYKNILNVIYNIIDDGTSIIKNSILNIKTIKILKDGFYYLENIGISIQGCESNKCIYEIIRQSYYNNIKINIIIKLEDKTLINLDF